MDKSLDLALANSLSHSLSLPLGVINLHNHLCTVELNRLERGFRDRDFIETREHFIFCVIGSVHPPDRVISYLKYIPSASGPWRRGNLEFRRTLREYTMRSLIDTISFLESHHPEYLYSSSVLGIRISAVPLNRILSHFKPEIRLAELSKRGYELSALEEKALELATRLSEESGVPLKYFGVTGSILLGIHQEFSDIDLTVYGIRNAKLVKEALRRIYFRKNDEISALDGAMAEDWCASKSRLHPLTWDDARNILYRKWNIGIFRGTYFSIHPVRLEDEVGEKYGDRIYRPEGMVKIVARVVDDVEADFMPAIYHVNDVKILEGKCVEDIREVASYEGLYSGIANIGEKIMVYGKLERVIDNRGGETYYRVLVGSQEAFGRDYIKPL